MFGIIRFRRKLECVIRIPQGIVEWIACSGACDPEDAYRPVIYIAGVFITPFNVSAWNTFIKIISKEVFNGPMPVPIR